MKSLCGGVVVAALAFLALCTRAQDLCDQGDASELLPWQQELLSDFPDGTSSLGRICFTTSQHETYPKAQAQFVLGVKTIVNFMYDLCKVVFDDILQEQPEFVMAYWGRSLCDFQGVWNAENPVDSYNYLALGRAMAAQQGVTLQGVEELLYNAAEELTNVLPANPTCTIDPEVPLADQISSSQVCRYQRFEQLTLQASQQFPENDLARSYALLGHLAVASVACTSTSLGACAPLETARQTAEEALRLNPSFVPFHHYGMHAYDYPDAQLFANASKYAEGYLLLANATTHSLHMPSHIWDRQGNFSLARESNRLSVAAADMFSASGALAYQGGSIGVIDTGTPNPDPDDPGTATNSSVSGYGFAFDAGNLYHSVEYEAYEALQGCDVAAANRIVARMGTAAVQAVTVGNGAVVEGTTAGAVNADQWQQAMGNGMYDATTYWQWQYRMTARHTHHALVMEMLGGAGGLLGHAVVEAARLAPPPLPLSWTGSTVYAHAFWSPQSEAAAWQATALAHLYLYAEDAAAAAVTGRGADGLVGQWPQLALLGDRSWGERGAENATWTMEACGGDASPSCTAHVTAMALQRIKAAALHYEGTGTPYEAKLTKVLWLQLAAMREAVAGNATGALTLSNEAWQEEQEAVNLLLPSSSTLFYVPGSAFHGALTYFVLQSGLVAPPAGDTDTDTGRRIDDALSAVGDCLAPTGRPNILVCLLARVRLLRSSTKPGVELLQESYSTIVELLTPTHEKVQAQQDALASRRRLLSKAEGYSRAVPSDSPSFATAISGPRFECEGLWRESDAYLSSPSAGLSSNELIGIGVGGGAVAVLGAAAVVYGLQTRAAASAAGVAVEGAAAGAADPLLGGEPSDGAPGAVAGHSGALGASVNGEAGASAAAWSGKLDASAEPAPAQVEHL